MPRKKICYECAQISFTKFATQILMMGTCDSCQALTGHSFPGCDLLFYDDIPDLERCDGGVRTSRFWTSFLINISFQSGHSSTASDLISILYPIPYRWMIREANECQRPQFFYVIIMQGRDMCRSGQRRKRLPDPIQGAQKVLALSR